MKKFTTIYFLSFLALTIAASAALPTPLWGLAAWRSVSFTASAALSAVLLLSLAGPVQDRVSGWLTGRAGARRVSMLVFYAALASVLWLLRPGHLLLGGLGQTAAETAGGSWYSPFSPLASALTQAVFKAVNSLFFIGAVPVVSAVSVICGLLSILPARSLAKSAAGTGPDGPEGWVPGAALIASGGYSAVFFGGDSTIATAVLMSSFFLAAAVRHIHGKAPVYLPMAVFMLAVFTHVASLFLAPGVIYLVVRGVRRKGASSDTLTAAAALVLAMAAFDLSLSFMTASANPSLGLVAAAGDAFREAAAGPAGSFFREWANVLLIMGPAGLFAFIAATGGGHRGDEAGDPARESENFLLVNALAAFVLVLAASPLADRGLRWEVFAPTGPVLAALAVTALYRRGKGSPAAPNASLLLVLLSLFHLLPIVILGVSRDAAVERLGRLPLQAGAAERIVGLDRFAAGEFEQASQWLEKSVELDPGQAESWGMLGRAAMENEDHIEAIGAFNKALGLSPGEDRFRESLAEAYIGQRWFEDAARELERLTADNPDQPRYLERLGYAYNHGGEFEKAVEAYEKLLSTDTGNMQYRRNLASAVLNLGASYHEDKEYDKAEEAYRRVMGLVPMSWVAKNNLAMVYMDRGDHDEAYRILEDALRTNEVAPKLHFNMALVQEKRGNYQDAMDHITRSVELSPGVPAPQEIMQRIWDKLQKQKEGAE